MDQLDQAYRTAVAKRGQDGWDTLPRKEQSAAILHELCRLDSGCQRTGAASDARLPPCPASLDFRARRRCTVSGDCQDAPEAS